MRSEGAIFLIIRFSLRIFFVRVFVIYFDCRDGWNFVWFSILFRIGHSFTVLLFRLCEEVRKKGMYYPQIFLVPRGFSILYVLYLPDLFVSLMFFQNRFPISGTICCFEWVFLMLFFSINVIFTIFLLFIRDTNVWS